MSRNRLFPKLTANQVLDYLEARLTREGNGDSPRWVFFREVRMGTGFSFAPSNGSSRQYPTDQRLDGWAMDTWPSGRFARKAFEVKVSRGDFLRELKHPEKRNAAFLVAEEFYFVTPEYMVDRGEIPEDCGLMWVARTGQIRTTVPAPKRKVEALDQRFMLSLLRRSQTTIRDLRFQIEDHKGTIEAWKHRAGDFQDASGREQLES